MGSSAPAAGTSGISEARRARVEAARRTWTSQLIDLSRRNPLLFFRDLKTGSLDLTRADKDAKAALLAGRTVEARRFFPAPDDTRTCATTLAIYRRSLWNLEERGLDTMFLALGFATWPAADQGRAHDAPVLLVPITAEMRAQDASRIVVKRAGDVQINPVLAFVMESDYGIRLDAEALVAAVQGDDEGEQYDLRPLLDGVQAACAAVTGFALEERAVIGNFAFQKMAMVQDLAQSAEAIAANDLVAALAGDADAQRAVAAARHEVSPGSIDAVAAANEFLILDADSSQQAVIAQVVAGQHGVIQGPPGTGKSQTIANLIAELVARGKRVLFVAEKRAALEVVLRRLEAKGLGHLALDLHGADLSRRQIMERLRESLDRVSTAPPVGAEPVHQRFEDRRARLNEHVQRLHTPRAPAGLSVFALQGQLLRLPPGAGSETRWRGAALAGLEDDVRVGTEDRLRELGASAPLVLREHPSPWTGAVLPDGAMAQQAVDRAHHLAQQLAPDALRELERLSLAAGVRKPATRAEAESALAAVEAVTTVCETYAVGIFDLPLDDVAVALAPASRVFRRMWAFLTDARFREARARVLGLRTGGPALAARLLAEMQQAADAKRHWSAVCPSTSRPQPDALVGRSRDAWTAFLREWSALLECLPPGSGVESLAELTSRLQALAADTVVPYQLPRLIAIEREIAAIGVGAILDEIRRKRLAPELWPLLFRHAWLSSCMDEARAHDPSLGAFTGRSHDLVVDEFKRLDRERLEVAVQRVRRLHAEAVIAAMNKHPEQTVRVRKEASKKARHMPFRKMIEEAPDVVTALRPCWMASPLAVSQLLPPRRLFDVVLFDEASQVLPEDAVPSIYRGTYTVVAGDQHQLPPTTFFAAGDGAIEEGEGNEVQGFESVLDLMRTMGGSWTLDWHYRSRDEALIAFSNRHIYSDRLVTFPGAHVDRVIEHVVVEQQAGQEGQEDSVSAEVERVVALILAHARERASETLGVITMGLKHANRLQAALDRELKTRRDLDAFFDATREERFFIKNLERVQGDERDAIILSVGYGKDAAGKLPYRFGPILLQGGERRLNVAVTRARHRLTTVSSFTHLDMDPGRSRSRGVELLRLYLEYAATGGRTLGGPGLSDVALNDFEQDVFDTLSAQGIPLLPQWGASRYRIDLVARHPGVDGRLVLAIECDGATYHSSHTARDRDRLRQQHLEALGWRFLRIWSTDWFLRKPDEVSRALRAYEDAVRWADRPRDVPTVPPPPVVTPVAVVGTRAPRPAVAPGRAITEYSARELDAIVRWVRSDGLLRTDDQLLDAVVDELGFARKGSRIVEAVTAALRRSST